MGPYIILDVVLEISFTIGNYIKPAMILKEVSNNSINYLKLSTIISGKYIVVSIRVNETRVHDGSNFQTISPG